MKPIQGLTRSQGSLSTNSIISFLYAIVVNIDVMFPILIPRYSAALACLSQLCARLPMQTLDLALDTNPCTNVVLVLGCVGSRSYLVNAIRSGSALSLHSQRGSTPTLPDPHPRLGSSVLRCSSQQVSYLGLLQFLGHKTLLLIEHSSKALRVRA